MSASHSSNRSPLQVTVLGSGSRGNALLVDGSAGTVLIDAGYGPRALQQRLSAVGRRHDEIQGLLLTHEHVDHASGAPAVSAKWGVTVHATPRTLAALDTLPDGPPVHRAALAEQGASVVAGFHITHCAVPHDAADCRGLPRAAADRCGKRRKHGRGAGLRRTDFVAGEFFVGGRPAGGGSQS
ncbi:MAG: hypothetical protein C0516_09045 [Gemmatimonas sp.]|nr:hypothetical protein [Gemmatimonas sp.]